MTQTGFHETIQEDGQFPPEDGRYHLYIGYSCPFAHRVNLLRHLKGLVKIIDVSIGRLRPKDDGIPEWVFTTDDDKIVGATRDKLYGRKVIREVYEHLNPEYKGRYTIPLLVDKKQNKIVNNESSEIMRNLSTAFDRVLSSEYANTMLYPEQYRNRIDVLLPKLHAELATGVYKAGFNPNQASYEDNLVIVFAMLNKLEVMLHKSDGKYMLGDTLTELDVVLFVCLIRFDVVYHQHMKCNLGMIRHDYPVLNAYMQHLYWNVPGFKETTRFDHIKENYTKAHLKVNPTGIVPLGPYPDILPIDETRPATKPGGVLMPRVTEQEIDFL